MIEECYSVFSLCLILLVRTNDTIISLVLIFIFCCLYYFTLELYILFIIPLRKLYLIINTINLKSLPFIIFYLIQNLYKI